jgi:hypothetical protein
MEFQYELLGSAVKKAVFLKAFCTLPDPPPSTRVKWFRCFSERFSSFCVRAGGLANPDEAPEQAAMTEQRRPCNSSSKNLL